MNSPTATLPVQPLLDDPRLPAFLAQQLQECGGDVELDPGGLWLVFVIEADDVEANALARTLLAGVRFVHDWGVSADDQWNLYYVDTAHRAAAVHWLQDLSRLLAGEIRPVAPEHRALIRDLAASELPQREAVELAERHARAELSAGSIHEPGLVRTLLDRWHREESLFLGAFRTLLAHHLLDLVVLLEQLAAEDIDLLNNILRYERSDEPVARSRRQAADEIRRILTLFHLINPLDLEKNADIGNPYAAWLGITCAGDRITAPNDRTMVMMLRRHVLAAIRATRKRLYRGEDFESFDTMAPWITEEVAYPFRYIKQRHQLRRDIAPMDWLYVFERAIHPGNFAA
jgi:hypothetical protein